MGLLFVARDSFLIQQYRAAIRDHIIATPVLHDKERTPKYGPGRSLLTIGDLNKYSGHFPVFRFHVNFIDTTGIEWNELLRNRKVLSSGFAAFELTAKRVAQKQLTLNEIIRSHEVRPNCQEYWAW